LSVERVDATSLADTVFAGNTAHRPAVIPDGTAAAQRALVVIRARAELGMDWRIGARCAYTEAVLPEVRIRGGSRSGSTRVTMAQMSAIEQRLPAEGRFHSDQHREDRFVEIVWSAR
jgi:hypothetical protein